MSHHKSIKAPKGAEVTSFVLSSAHGSFSVSRIPHGDYAFFAVYFHPSDGECESLMADDGRDPRTLVDAKRLVSVKLEQLDVASKTPASNASTADAAA